MKNKKQIIGIPLIAILLSGSYLITQCKHDTANLEQLDTICFESQVLPIFIGNCTQSGCHSGNGGEFALTNYNEIMSKIKAGKPTSSDIYNAITAKNLMPQMPPDYALTETQRTYIRIWILQGAKDTKCSENCDSVNVTYSKTIQPILNTSCIGCHSAGNPSGEVVISNYNNVKALVNSGQLIGTITGTDYPQMPPSNPLSTCKIGQIRAWVKAGALNN